MSNLSKARQPAEREPGPEAGLEPGREAGPEARLEPGPEPGPKAGPEPGPEAGPEVRLEPGPEAGPEAGLEPGLEPGLKAALEPGPKAGLEADPGLALCRCSPVSHCSLQNKMEKCGAGIRRRQNHRGLELGRLLGGSWEEVEGEGFESAGFFRFQMQCLH